MPKTIVKEANFKVHINCVLKALTKQLLLV